MSNTLTTQESPIPVRDTRILDDWQSEASRQGDSSADGMKSQEIAIPEIVEAIRFANEHPDTVTRTFLGYQRLYEFMITMTEEEHSIVAEAEAILQESERMSASLWVPWDLHSMITPSGRKDLSNVMSRMPNPEENAVYVAALERFASMLSGGHTLAREGRQPRDGDPDFDRVIWGHTQLDGDLHPEAMLHFLVTHFIERYVCEAIQRGDIEIEPGYREEAAQFTRKKDAILNALTAALLVREVVPPSYYDMFRRRDRFHHDILTYWRMPKSEGGLGWISEEQIDAYWQAYRTLYIT